MAVAPSATSSTYTRLGTLCWLAAVPLLYALAAIFLLPQDANWDLRNYHWYNAYAFLNGRFGFDLVPAQVPTFYNPLLDVPFYLLAAHLPGQGAVFILALVQGLNFPLLYLLVKKILPEERAGIRFLLPILGMVGGGTLAELGTTFYDNVLSLGIITSLLLVITACARENRGAAQGLLRFALAGVPVGLATGLKEPMIIYAAGLTAAFFLMPWRWDHRLKIGVAFGAGCLAGLLLGAGDWMWLLWQQFHNPLFPYFNGLLGGIDGSAINVRDTKFIPPGMGRLWLAFGMTAFPQMVGEIDWRDPRVAIWWALVLVQAGRWLGQAARRIKARSATAPPEAATPAQHYLATAGVLSYLAWLLLFCIYRYLIPFEMIAPILIVLALDRLLPGTKIRLAASLILLVLIAASIRPGDWHHVPWGEPHDALVRVTLPVIPAPDKTMILMTGLEPFADVLPSFPPQIPFIRIESNFSSPFEPGKSINRLFARRIARELAEGGQLFVLFSQYDIRPDRALAAFGLEIAGKDLQKCQIVRHNLYDQYLHFCPLTPISRKAP